MGYNGFVLKDIIFLYILLIRLEKGDKCRLFFFFFLTTEKLCKKKTANAVLFFLVLCVKISNSLAPRPDYQLKASLLCRHEIG